LGEDHAEKQHDAQRKRNQQGAPLRQWKRTIALIGLLFGHKYSSRALFFIRGVLETL
jgi:hypothetical protein